MRRAAMWIAAAMGAALICASAARAQDRVNGRVATPYVGAQVTFAQRYSPPVRAGRVQVSSDDYFRGDRLARAWVKGDRQFRRDLRDARREFEKGRRKAVRELRRDVQKAARAYARYAREVRRDLRW